MARRIMYVQLKTGYDTDRGPSWVAWVRFSKTWKTAYFHGRTLRRWPGMSDANFSDVETGERFWVSGPKRDRTDGRYGRALPEVRPNARKPLASLRNYVMNKVAYTSGVRATELCPVLLSDAHW